MSATSEAVGTCARGTGSIESVWSWWVAAVAVLMASLGFGAVMAVPVLLKPLAAEWNTGATSVSLVHASGMFGSAFGALLFGRLVDRYGMAPIGFTAAACVGGGLLIAASARELLTLHVVFGVLLGGVGQGCLFCALTAGVARWFDRRQAFVIALVATGQNIGGLFMPPLVRWAEETSGWRSALAWYGIVAGVALFAGTLNFLRAPPTRAVTSLQSAKGQAASLSRGVFLTLGSCMALLNYATFVGIGHLTAFGEEQGYAPTTAALLVAALLGVGLVSRLSLGSLTPRFGTYRVIVVMASIQLTGMAALIVARQYPAIMAAALLIGFGFGGYLPAFAIFVRERCRPAEAGQRMAEIYFFGFSAAGVGSCTAGWLRDVTGGYRGPFSVAAGCALAGVVILLLLVRGRGASLFAPSRQNLN